MKKFLIAGDTHGNINHLYWLVRRADNVNVRDIIVLGDFGYWEHSPAGKEFLNTLNEILTKHNVNLIFIDGNHENHTMLRAYMNDESEDWQKPIKIRNRITWWPRGYRTEIEGVKILAIGGAFSIDVDNRIEGISWWPEETISYSEAMRACIGGKVDIVLSHDAPFGGPIEPILAQSGIGYKLDSKSKANRNMLKAVVDNVKPSLILHGHFHYQYTGEYLYDDETFARIVGYGADVNERHESYGYLTLHNGEWA